MNKIQKVSFFLRSFFQIIFFVLPILLVLFWLFAPVLYPLYPYAATYFIPSGIEILHPLSVTNCLFGFLINLLPTVVTMYILHFLIKLFSLYEKGAIFTYENAKYIKKIAITMLIGQFVRFIYEVLISIALTIDNPAGHRVGTITFNNYDVYNIITAIMLIVISWIMAEGAKLKEEQSLTV